MGWRIAATWALLGFASQCVLAVLKGLDLVTGLEHALLHYLGWGAAGYVVGTITGRIIEDSFRRRHASTESEESASLPASDTETDE